MNINRTQRVGIWILFGLALIGTGAYYFWYQKYQTKEENSRSSVQDFEKNTEKTAVGTSNWKTYRNKELGITFKYPKNWTVGEDFGYLTAVIYINPLNAPPGEETISISIHTRTLTNGKPDVPFTEADREESINSVQLNNAKRYSYIIDGVQGVEIGGVFPNDARSSDQAEFLKIALLPNEKMLLEIEYKGANGPFKKEFTTILSTFKFIK